MVKDSRAHLKLVDGRVDCWKQAVQKLFSEGSNFVLLLKNQPESLRDLGCTLDIPEKELPPPAKKVFTFTFSRCLKPTDFAHVKEAFNQHDLIFSIQHLYLANVRPPRVKPFILYCDISGIRSQHGTFEEATAAWRKMAARGNGGLSENEIYSWSENGWLRTTPEDL